MTEYIKIEKQFFSKIVEQNKEFSKQLEILNKENNELRLGLPIDWTIDVSYRCNSETTQEKRAEFEGLIKNLMLTYKISNIKATVYHNL